MLNALFRMIGRSASHFAFVLAFVLSSAAYANTATSVSSPITVNEDSGAFAARQVAVFNLGSGTRVLNEQQSSATFTVAGGLTFSTVPTLSFSTSTSGGNSIATVSLAFQPAANSNGSASVTVNVIDDNSNGSTVVRVVVTAVNDTATITLNPSSLAVNEDSAAQTVSVTIADTVDGGTAPAFTSDPTVFPTGIVSAARMGANLVVTPMANQNGRATVTVTVTDANGGAQTRTVTAELPVEVTAVNDTATITLSTTRITVNEDSAAQTVSVTIADTADGGTPPTFVPTVSPTGIVGAVRNGANLVVTPVANQNGRATVTFTVTDTNGGAQTRTVTAELPVTVTAVNDTATITLNPPSLTVNEDSAARTVTVTITDPSDGGTAPTFTTDPEVSPAGIVTAARMGANLVVTPVPNANGRATVTVSVADTNGGSASTVTATLPVTVNPVNDTPTVVSAMTVTVPPGAASSSYVAAVFNLGEQGDTLSSSSVIGFTTAVLSTTPTLSQVTAGGISTLSLTFAPRSGVSAGRSSVTIQVVDSGNATETAVVTVVVMQPQPSFTVGSGQRVESRSGAQRVANFITDVASGEPMGSTVQAALNFDVTVSSTRLFSVEPAVAIAGVTGTLSYTPVSGTTGVVTVTLALVRTDTNPDRRSSSQTFTITVTDYFGGGAGTAADPYRISTASHLANVAQYRSANFRLQNEIALATAWTPIVNFGGSIDGAGNVISGLYVNSAASMVGLFGSATGATFSTLRIALDARGVVGGSRVGALVGWLQGDNTITNVSVTSGLSGTTGVVAVSTGVVYAGGLVGGVPDGASLTIHRSYAITNVRGSTRSDRIGGLVGFANSMRVRQSFASGSVSGGARVGGLIGHVTNIVSENNYSLGDVDGRTNVGGLIGWITANTSNTVSRSYVDASTISASASDGLGGYLVGNAQTSGTFSYLYHDNSTPSVLSLVSTASASRIDVGNTSGVNFASMGKTSASFPGLSTSVWSYTEAGVSGSRGPVIIGEARIGQNPVPVTPTPPASSSSSGCALGSGTAFDPILLMLMAGAVFLLYKRRRTA